MYVYVWMQLRSNTLRWCKANFGEIFSAWIHLKVRPLVMAAVTCMYVCMWVYWVDGNKFMYVCM